MLAKRLLGILPPLSFEEALETTKIYSVTGHLAPGEALIARTIADLADCEVTRADHIAAAIQYRSLDRKRISV